ncbi:MAG: beta-phosphoglucomutase family hydrolase [Desulfuromonas sp.]|nr:beta-phosphoglucomutase family hydrolase [Desulfuromonas sp.]
MQISLKKYDAVLFDLDGVLTMTMKIHASCWKRMFDAYLQERSKCFGETHQPFDISSDYKSYVDGKLRADGVRAFLSSRNIALAEGSPDDAPSLETICGLGNRKNLLVKDVIAAEGVEIIKGSLTFAHRVRSLGLKTAVVSASKNCEMILQAAGIRDLFDCIVDGKVAERNGLPGKPAPDTFLAAAEALNVAPHRSVVVEDAISGVQAGQAGGFGLVIGIDHHGDKRVLLKNGADIVVKDLMEILDNGHK